MNQRQLSYFLEVYRKRSITAAAKELFISPQGLSKTILTLEEELGLRLFDRNGKRMIPTQAAVNLTSHATAICEEYELITRKQFLDRPLRKPLRILCSYDIPSFFPAEFYHEFHTLYPEILLNITEMPDLQILRLLENNEAELALLGGPLDAMIYDLTYLFTNCFCLMIHRENPLAQKECITAEDLSDYPLAIKGMALPLSNIQQNHFLSHGVNPAVLVEVSDYHVLHELADKNYCVSMTLDYLARRETMSNLVIRPFANDVFKKSVYLAHRKNYPYSHHAFLFKEFISEWSKKQDTFRESENDLPI